MSGGHGEDGNNCLGHPRQGNDAFQVGFVVFHTNLIPQYIDLGLRKLLPLEPHSC